jgi:hypothetical protein
MLPLCTIHPLREVVALIAVPFAVMPSKLPFATKLAACEVVERVSAASERTMGRTICVTAFIAA